jgi:hypothetical protein
LAAAKTVAARFPQADNLTIAHRDLLFRTEPIVDQVIAFLGRPELDRAAMIAAVDRSLYRSRGPGSA